jgi:hypothetical protein
MRATDRTREHTPAFASIWRTCVLAPHDLGERDLELHSGQVDRFFVNLSNADSTANGALSPSVATSHASPMTEGRRWTCWGLAVAALVL